MMDLFAQEVNSSVLKSVSRTQELGIRTAGNVVFHPV